jgi:hypothetical protein
VVRFRSTEASVQFHPAARGLQEVDFPLAMLGGKRTSARSVTRKTAGFLIAEVSVQAPTNRARKVIAEMIAQLQGGLHLS